MSQKINNRKRFSSENHQVSNEPSTGIYLIYYFITYLSTEVKPYLCNNFYCTVKSNVLPNMQLPKSQNLTSNSLCDTSSIIINKYASPFNIESQPSNPHTQPSNFVLQNNRRKKFGDTSTMPVNLIKRFANRTSASNSFVQSDGENRKHQQMKMLCLVHLQIQIVCLVLLQIQIFVSSFYKIKCCTWSLFFNNERSFHTMNTCH